VLHIVRACSRSCPACKGYATYVICGLSGPAVFSTLSHKRHDCLEKVVEHKIYVLMFSTTLISNVSYSKKKWARNDKNILMYSCKVLVIPARF
jgi:hypothetical protein